MALEGKCHSVGESFFSAFLQEVHTMCKPYCGSRSYDSHKSGGCIRCTTVAYFQGDCVQLVCGRDGEDVAQIDPPEAALI